MLIAVGVLQFRDASAGDMAGLVAIYLAAAVFLLAYIRRHVHLAIRVDTEGLNARSYLRHIGLGWNDVTGLDFGEVPRWLGGGRIYRVRSSKGTFIFFSSWPGADMLARMIATATGLEWERG